MIWPWVSRARLDAAEQKATAAEMARAAVEARIADLSAALENQRHLLAETKEACEQERRKLMDRICRLSGQPPLYEQPAATPEPAASPAKEPDPKTLARILPKTRATFDDVHGAARAAMAAGNFDPDRARIRA